MERCFATQHMGQLYVFSERSDNDGTGVERVVLHLSRLQFRRHSVLLNTDFSDDTHLESHVLQFVIATNVYARLAKIHFHGSLEQHARPRFETNLLALQLSAVHMFWTAHFFVGQLWQASLYTPRSHAHSRSGFDQGGFSQVQGMNQFAKQFGGMLDAKTGQYKLDSTKLSFLNGTLNAQDWR